MTTHAQAKIHYNLDLINLDTYKKITSAPDNEVVRKEPRPKQFHIGQHITIECSGPATSGSGIVTCITDEFIQVDEQKFCAKTGRALSPPWAYYIFVTT